jgi:hypothetical protein
MFLSDSACAFCQDKLGEYANIIAYHTNLDTHVGFAWQRGAVTQHFKEFMSVTIGNILGR